MRILFLGDIVGRDAREAAIAKIAGLRKEHNIDCVIINGENSVNGFGITGQVCEEFYQAGVDCVTTGNHVWDQRSVLTYIDGDARLLRPLNFPDGTPGRGFTIVNVGGRYKILVINAIGRMFMEPSDDPFAAIDKVLKSYVLGRDVNAIVLDFHGEATSEKVAMGHFCDGRASLVVGTHTHIPTADAHILPKGTGYQSDSGMCGVYDSIIGMDKDIALNRFIRKIPGERLHPAQGEVTLCGVMVDVNPSNGLCEQIIPLRLGGSLQETKLDA